MIYGALGDIEEYRGMLKGLDVLIDWLEENDPAQLEVGSHPILGEKGFANVMSPTTRPEAEAHYETHQRYHDLQIDVEGREAFKVATGSLTLVHVRGWSRCRSLPAGGHPLCAHAGRARQRCAPRRRAVPLPIVN